MARLFSLQYLRIAETCLEYHSTSLEGELEVTTYFVDFGLSTREEFPVYLFIQSVLKDFSASLSVTMEIPISLKCAMVLYFFAALLLQTQHLPCSLKKATSLLDNVLNPLQPPAKAAVTVRLH